VFSLKRKRTTAGQKTRHLLVSAPRVDNTPTSPCWCSQYPPAIVGRAARPRAPTPPAMLTLKRLALPKLGGAGGSPLAAAEAAALSPGPSLFCRLVAPGRRAGRTGSAGKPGDRAPCWGRVPSPPGGGLGARSPTIAGGVNTKYSQLLTRECSKAATRYPHQEQGSSPYTERTG